MPHHVSPALLRLASSLPAESKERQILKKMVASAAETYHTEGGKKFVIKTVMFSKFLREEMGVKPGVASGQYLREEMQVPDKYLRVLKDKYRARVTGLPREVTPGLTRNVPKRGPDINKLWDKLVDALNKSVRGEGSDIADWYVRDPKRKAEDFDSFLQTAAGDMSMNWEWSLSGRAEKLWEQFREALRTGLYTGGEYGRWNLREKTTILGEVYADAWYGEMSAAWRKLQRNPREMARLNAMRGT